MRCTLVLRSKAAAVDVARRASRVCAACSPCPCAAPLAGVAALRGRLAALRSPGHKQMLRSAAALAAVRSWSSAGPACSTRTRMARKCRDRHRGRWCGTCPCPARAARCSGAVAAQGGREPRSSAPAPHCWTSRSMSTPLPTRTMATREPGRHRCGTAAQTSACTRRLALAPRPLRAGALA
jgi:hypothetical protein